MVQVHTESGWVGADAIGGFDNHQIPVPYKIASPGDCQFLRVDEKKSTKSHDLKDKLKFLLLKRDPKCVLCASTGHKRRARKKKLSE